jgi:uncharacterized protein DUF2452
VTDLKRSPNPQGKGLTPLLESLYQTKQGLCVPAKNIDRITNELFTSLFVLHSTIKFKPIIGQSYWLYNKNSTFQLSLIAPHQWLPEKSGEYVGHCRLQTDLTWSLNLSDKCQQNEKLIAIINQLRKNFEWKLKQAEQIDDILPVYIASLPFYSRVLASALAYSLNLSMQKSGINGLNYYQAQKRLPTN